MGKVVFISGASSGFGKHIATALAKEGHRVYGTSRNKSDEVLPYQLLKMDVTDKTSINKAIEEVLQKENKIDVLINNAGMGIAGETELTSQDEMMKIFNTNFFGLVNLTHRVLPIMRKQKNGLIINVSSLAGIFSIPFQTFYSASKFAIEGYSQGLRFELQGSGIKLVLINPGDYRTGFTSHRQLIESKGLNDEKFKSCLKIIEKDEMGGANPEIVAGLISGIIKKSNPAHRYLTGRFDQKLAANLKNILPAKLFYSIIKSHYGM